MPQAVRPLFLAIFPLLTHPIHAESPAGSNEGSAPMCHVARSTSPEDALPPTPPSEAWPAQVNVPVEVRDTVAKNGLKTKTILFKDMRIDRIYPSMRGPWTRAYVRLDGAEGDFVWVRRYRAEVLDGKTGAASQEFMCHTNMDLAGAEGKPNAFQRIRSELSISQGQKEVAFPKGFALRIPSGPDVQNDVNVMVLNNNDPSIRKSLDFKVTIDYLDEATAKAQQLIPLVQMNAGINCPTVAGTINRGDTPCVPASKFLVEQGGDRRTGHWLVDPGRHRFSNHLANWVPADAQIHYIWMHVHPYAESIELLDETNGKSVWKGMVRNAAHQAVVLATDYYSSTQGIPLYKDHVYKLVATYNNPTPQPIDAMAALWMYAREEN